MMSLVEQLRAATGPVEPVRDSRYRPTPVTLRRVAEQLSDTPVTSRAISEATGIAITQVRNALVELVAQGVAERVRTVARGAYEYVGVSTY